MKPKPRLIELNSLDKLKMDIDADGNQVLDDVKQKKTEVVNFRMEPALSFWTFEMCRRLGMDRSQLIHRLLVKEAESMYVKNPQSCQEIEKCNTNIPSQNLGTA